MEKLEIEKISEQKKENPLNNDPLKDALTLNSENILKAFQLQGKIPEAKVENSDFESLEDSSDDCEPQKNKQKSQEQNLNKMMLNISENLGVNSSNLLPVPLEKSSVQTKSLKEENSEQEEPCHFERKKIERYFDDVSSVKCFKCGKLGHTRNTCLVNTKVESLI